MGVDTLGTDKELGKILRLSVGDSPWTALRRIKHGLLVLLILRVGLRLCLFFIIFLTLRFLDWLGWLLWLGEFFVLDLVLFDVVLVQAKGKANYRADLTNDIFDGKHLVHGA